MARKQITMLRVALQSVVGLVVLAGGVARSEPVLQLYIEGATYDQGTESWVFNDEGATVFRLWTIGNTDTEHSGFNPIENVRLSVVYSKQYEADHGPVQIVLTPTTAGGVGFYEGFDDPSTPGDPAFIQKVTDGSVPLLSDGSELPSHGEYSTDVIWQEFLLGDFSLMDSPLADFIDSFPTTDLKPNSAQINVYEVRVNVLNPEGVPPISLHFDLYDSVQAGNKSKSVFAPFSHDAGGDTNPGVIVPEPSTLALSLIGLVAAGGAAYRRRRSFRVAAASDAPPVE